MLKLWQVRDFSRRLHLEHTGIVQSIGDLHSALLFCSLDCHHATKLLNQTITQGHVFFIHPNHGGVSKKSGNFQTTCKVFLADVDFIQVRGFKSARKRQVDASLAVEAKITLTIWFTHSNDETPRNANLQSLHTTINVNPRAVHTRCFRLLDLNDLQRRERDDFFAGLDKVIKTMRGRTTSPSHNATFTFRSSNFGFFFCALALHVDAQLLPL